MDFFKSSYKPHLFFLCTFWHWYAFADHDAMMLVASDNGLHEYRLNSTGIHYNRNLLNGRRVDAVTVMVSKNLVFWEDCSNSHDRGCVIKRAEIKLGTLLNQSEIFTSKTIWRSHLKADWIHNNLYWIERYFRYSNILLPWSVIMVGDIDGRYNKSIYTSQRGVLTSMTLDPREGWIFVTENDVVNGLSKILKIAMDGSEEMIIYTLLEKTDVFGLTIDHYGNKINWFETNRIGLLAGKGSEFVTGNLDGSNPLIFSIIPTSASKNNMYPMHCSIAILGDFVIISNGKNLQKLKKTPSFIEMQLIHSTNVKYINDLVIFDGKNQPRGCNYCGDGNKKGCSYICVPVPRKTSFNIPYRCLCPNDYPSCDTKEVSEAYEKQNTCEQIQHFSTGHFLYPNCTESGEFDIQQCDIRNGHNLCRCSDKQGITIPGTERKNGDGLQCDDEVSEAYEKQNTCEQIQHFSTGHFLYPNCTESGEFDIQQCDIRNGHNLCRCSDKQGITIPGTERKNGDGLQCDDEQSLGPCLYQLVLYKRRESSLNYEPRCTLSGEFEDTQCNASICWCVDAMGNPTTDKTFKQPEIVTCSHKESSLNYEPRCTLSGEFEDTQCNASICWCVDAMGNPTTDKTFKQPEIVTCSHKEQSLGPCLYQLVLYKRRESSLNYEPRCTLSGEFEDTQCNASICWCVDAMGNPTTDKTFKQPEIVTCSHKESYKTHFYVTLSILACVTLGFILYRRRIQKDHYTEFRQAQDPLYSDLDVHRYEDISIIELPVLLREANNEEDNELPTIDNQQPRQS